MNEQVTGLEEMLDQIEAAADRKYVSFAMVVNAVGTRSFGPLLLLAGLVLTSPLSGIPGMPTAMGVLVLLISLQLLYRRDCCWVPPWLLRRSVARDKLATAIRWLKPPARVVDRWLKPRLLPFVRGIGGYLIALVCLLIALSLPVMEFLPFSSTAAGIALATFGLALVSQDGLLALVAFALTASAVLFILQTV